MRTDAGGPSLAVGVCAVVVLLGTLGYVRDPHVFERLSSVASSESATEAFGWMSSGFAVGNALGTALGGLLVTVYGVRAPIVAACAVLILAALICEPWRR
jgi:predicted MFS family arabinose efflux permease